MFFGPDSSAFKPGEADGIHTFTLGGPIFAIAFLKGPLNTLTTDKEIRLEARVGDDLVLINRFDAGNDAESPVVVLEIISDMIFLQNQYENAQKNLAFCKGILECGKTGVVPVEMTFTSENAKEPLAVGTFSLNFDDQSGVEELKNVIGMLEKYKTISPADMVKKQRADASARSKALKGVKLYRRSGGNTDGFVYFNKGGKNFFCGILEARDTPQYSLEGSFIKDRYKTDGGVKLEKGQIRNEISNRKVFVTDTTFYLLSSSDGFVKEGNVLRPATTGCVFEKSDWIIEEGFPMTVAAFVIGGFRKK